MNLYKYHTNPDQLKYSYKEATEKVPQFAWEKYSSNKKELQKREDLWAQDAKTAFKYSLAVLDKPFPAGEAAIAKSPRYAFLYSYLILTHTWDPGEEAIASDPDYADRYMDVFNLSFIRGKFVRK